MTEIQIQPVRTQRDQRTFLTFPWRIYQDDPLWVPPLLPEMKKRMDPSPRRVPPARRSGVLHRAAGNRAGRNGVRRGGPQSQRDARP